MSKAMQLKLCAKDGSVIVERIFTRLVSSSMK
jgi:hypothetical protein